MKTSELKKELNKMGLYLVGEIIRDKNSGDGNMIAVIASADVGMLDTNFDSFYRLSEQDRLRLLELLYNYSITPPSERKEPKKYYVKPKGIKVHLERVYTYISIQKTWELLRKDIDYEWQNIFTLEELKELGVPIEHYDLIDTEG